jgi:uncharacterized protein
MVNSTASAQGGASVHDRLIYLHGFRSSPQSTKARWLASAMHSIGRSAQFQCPQLPASPRESVELVRREFDLQAADTLVGSSLGGYYATYLAERYGCRAVLLNPAIQPARDLKSMTGPQTMFHSDAAFDFRAEYLSELRDMDTGTITFPARYFLIAAKGDELLDWREMVARYRGARHLVLEGSDHGLSNFSDYGHLVLEFAGHLIPT